MFDKLGYSYFCHQNQYNTSYSELKLGAHFFSSDFHKCFDCKEQSNLSARFCSDGESQWMMDMGAGMWWNATLKAVTCGRVMTIAIMEKGQRAFTHLQAQQLS
jgi:hypothetical protein